MVTPCVFDAGGDAVVEDEELFGRRGAEAVHQHRHLRAAGEREVGENRIDHRVGYPRGALQLPSMHTWFAMDAHADFHLIVAD